VTPIIRTIKFPDLVMLSQHSYFLVCRLGLMQHSKIKYSYHPEIFQYISRPQLGISQTVGSLGPTSHNRKLVLDLELEREGEDNPKDVRYCITLIDMNDAVLAVMTREKLCASLASPVAECLKQLHKLPFRSARRSFDELPLRNGTDIKQSKPSFLSDNDVVVHPRELLNMMLRGR
jgi:hypothetical protein